MKQGFRENTYLGEALNEFLSIFEAVDTETVGLEEATERVAAAEVVAERSMPHYDRAAMDGYAVRASDTHGASGRSPVRLSIVEGDERIDEGEAAYVHTGSPVPEGADGVVRVEDTDEVSGSVEVSVAVSEGENVAYAGEDVSEGEVVVEEGVRLRPSTVGVLRSVGVDEVEVRRKPHVRVVPTGDEVVESDPAPGEVVGTNGPMVAEYVERWGGKATISEAVPDDEEALNDALGEATDTADLVATTGGSSVGDRDLVHEVVEDIGEVTVHGVAVKPGYPVGFGVVGDTVVVMLPGYPVSCVVNAFEFVRRGVYALLGDEEEIEPSVRCTLDDKIPSEVGVKTYTRVEVEKEEDGRVAHPLRTKGAGVLSSVAECDGFVVTSENREGYASGEEVDVLLWGA